MAHVNRSRNLDKRVLALNPDLRVDALSVLVCNSTGNATGLSSKSEEEEDEAESSDVEPAEDLAQASTESEIMEVVFERREDWTMEVFLPKMKAMPEPESLVAVDAQGVRREMFLTAPPWETVVTDLVFPVSLVITPKRAAAAAVSTATESAAPMSQSSPAPESEAGTGATAELRGVATNEPPESADNQPALPGVSQQDPTETHEQPLVESGLLAPEASQPGEEPPPILGDHQPPLPSDEGSSAGLLPPVMDPETETPSAPVEAQASDATGGELQESDPEFELPRDGDAMARLKLAMTGMPR